MTYGVWYEFTLSDGSKRLYVVSGFRALHHIKRNLKTPLCRVIAPMFALEA